MRVTARAALAVSGTSGFGEIFVLVDEGASAPGSEIFGGEGNDLCRGGFRNVRLEGCENWTSRSYIYQPESEHGLRQRLADPEGRS